jgi:hypothetical protein
VPLVGTVGVVTAHHRATLPPAHACHVPDRGHDASMVRLLVLMHHRIAPAMRPCSVERVGGPNPG